MLKKLIEKLFSKPFSSVRLFLSGKKSYLTGIALIVSALIAYSEGKLEIWEMVKQVLEGLAIISVRAGIKKGE